MAADLPLPAGLSWQPFSDGRVPVNAVKGGWSSDTNEPFYVGRSGHKGDITPGKVHPGHGCLYLPSGAEEHKHKSYEVLQADPAVNLHWLRYSGGHVPPGAVPGGVDHDAGGPSYIGRTVNKHKGDTVPGKIVPKLCGLYFASGGKEYFRSEYEVLVVDDPDEYELSDVKFDIAGAKSRKDPNQVSIGKETFTNRSPLEQSSTLCIDFQDTKTENWGHQVGIKLGVKTSFKTGIPCIVEGKVEVSGEFSYQHSWGSVRSTSSKQAAQVNVKAGPNSQVVAEMRATKYQIDVNYSATLKHLKDGKITKTEQISGTYKGAQFADFDVTVSKPTPL